MTESKPREEYFAHLAAGRFMVQRSRSSGQYVFFPRVAEPGTGARDLEWVEVSGRGIVHATTIMRPKPPQAPYNVALIELEEGPRLMSRVEGVAPEAVKIGMRVKARVANEDGTPILLFDSAEGAA